MKESVQGMVFKAKKGVFYFTLLLGFFGAGLAVQAQHTARKIGDNPLTIEQTAVLELESTSKGFIMPRMTEAQRDAITTPANGLMIFNTTSQSINVYDVSFTSWRQIESKESTLITSFTSSFTTPYNFRVTITNLSTVDITPTFSTSDVNITGVTGATVTAVDDTSETIAPQASHSINYTISYGSATAAAPLAIQGTYIYANQTTSSTTNGGSNTTRLHNGLFYNN